jgi:hypothetical protein
MTDIHFAAIEMDGCDEPVFVAADIENNPVVHLIGGREDLSQLGKTVEFGLLHNFEPAPQRHLTIGIFLPELGQRFAGDDVHARILSQIEILGKAVFLPPHRFDWFRKTSIDLESARLSKPDKPARSRKNNGTMWRMGSSSVRRV